jgi:hypothetical protein
LSKNKKLDRRHDINAGEMLPQRLTRVEDMEVYWDGIEKVLSNEQDAAFVAEQKSKKDKVAMELAEKKASIKVGDSVLLLWAGVQVVRVDDIRDESVKVGPVWYGWERVKKPSEAFLKAVETELPGVVL